MGAKRRYEDRFTRYALKIAAVQFVIYSVLFLLPFVAMNWLEILSFGSSGYLVLALAAAFSAVIGGYSAAGRRLESELITFYRVLGDNLVRETVRHTLRELNGQVENLPEHVAPDGADIFNGAIAEVKKELHYHPPFDAINIDFMLSSWTVIEQ